MIILGHINVSTIEIGGVSAHDQNNSIPWYVLAKYLNFFTIYDVLFP